MKYIPSSLKKLHFLSSFSVANNDLQGSIPTGGQFDISQRKVLEGNPHLCGPVLQRPYSDPPNAHVQIQSSEHTENSEITVTFWLIF